MQRSIALIAFAMGIGVGGLASAQVTLESSCEQYGRHLTSDVAPDAVMGTQEYRSVFFPARDECIRRGGPQFMPNGTARAPFYAAGGTPNPPPSATSNPPLSTPATQPTPQSPVRPATAPTTPQLDMARAQAIYRAAQAGLPAGMSMKQSVTAAMSHCERTAVAAADRTYPTRTAQWDRLAAGELSRCASAAPMVNGKPNYNPVLRMTLASAADAPTGQPPAPVPPGMDACSAPASDGSQICGDGNGGLFVCIGSTCIDVDIVMTVRVNIGNGMIAFFNCAGGSCMIIPVNEYPRGRDSGGVVARRESPRETFQNCKALNPDFAKARDCYVARCIANTAGLESWQFPTPEQCRREFYTEWNKDVGFTRQMVEQKVTAPRGWSLPESPGVDWSIVTEAVGETLANNWDVLAIGGVAILLVVAPPAGVAGAAWLSAASAGGAALLVVSAGGPDDGLRAASHAGTQANLQATARQVCSATIGEQFARTPAPMNPVHKSEMVKLMTEICVANIPGVEERRRIMVQMFQRCDKQAQEAAKGAAPGAPVSRYSQALNVCLRARAMEVAQFGKVPQHGSAFGNGLSAKLRTCAVDRGMNWSGGLADGMIVPLQGAPGGGQIATISDCYRQEIARTQ